MLRSKTKENGAKNMKAKKLSIGITVSLLFSLFFSACFMVTKYVAYDGWTIRQSYFYHTWNRISPADQEVDYSVTFSANAIDVHDRSGWTYRVSPISWKEVTNTSFKTMNDFPSGYQITGTVSAITGSPYGWKIGDAFGPDTTFLLHKDLDIIYWRDDNTDSITELVKR